MLLKVDVPKSYDNCKDDSLSIPSQKFYYRHTELVAKELVGKDLRDIPYAIDALLYAFQNFDM